MENFGETRNEGAIGGKIKKMSSSDVNKLKLVQLTILTELRIIQFVGDALTCEINDLVKNGTFGNINISHVRNFKVAALSEGTLNLTVH